MRLPLVLALVAVAVAAALALGAVTGGGAPTAATGAGNPFAGAQLYVDADSPARRQADEWRQTRPGAAALLDRIASRPFARWFPDWRRDVRADVAHEVSEAAAARALPVLVAYAIPARDCGGLAAGGAPTAAAYRTWIRRFAAGIGAYRAAVILEPDALAGLDCLAARARRERLNLLRDAVAVISARPRATLYVDAGNARWQPPAVIADRLRRVGVGRARGFALNVSNFLTTGESIRYGHAVAAGLPGARFVIDTSRNGRGPAPDGQWCNPPGRGLGSPPTTRTGDSTVDALLWVKFPGESDGACRGAPQAGAWWPKYALGLAARAAAVR